MNDRHDLELVLRSAVPIIVVETTDESRFLGLLSSVAVEQSAANYRPLFRWSVTDGLQRIDLNLEPQRHNSAPEDVLGHIRAIDRPAIYALLDFHPYLENPVTVRLLKDIAISSKSTGAMVILISHAIEIPRELQAFSARFELSLPDDDSRRRIVERAVESYRADNPTSSVEIDSTALELLVQNLSGLTHAETARLAHNAIYQDGAISTDDIPEVMKAKYELLNHGGVLSYEYDTRGFDDIGGFSNVKAWLRQRATAFHEEPPAGLDTPKGILLIGVQGCGKSLAAKAAAGVLGLPLLRLDFGAVYSKYHGETERNLRESLRMADLMSPCVLWIDEIEKGLAGGHDETGTSRRVVGTFLTWMAERRSRVLIVATANNINAMAPELVRKGRFDEVFFVDLPGPTSRADILSIHLRRRGIEPATLAIPKLVDATDGFSGAEIEQAIVAALYAAHAVRQKPSAEHLLAEFRRTRPLSVMMAETISALRLWAESRTVPADSQKLLDEPRIRSYV
jgi:SpoVK/Ycf46/Vps4 family AAA+-type ATPase